MSRIDERILAHWRSELRRAQYLLALDSVNIFAPFKGSTLERSTFVLVLVSVLLSSIAQLVLKEGMSSATVQMAGAQGVNLRLALAIALNYKILCGLLIYFASAAVWLFVLARIPVGLAYPFVGLGFVLTMLLAWLLRGETPSAMQVLGTLTICLGVTLMARA
jgi:multidrug transporter EmrE-like cation transporter